MLAPASTSSVLEEWLRKTAQSYPAETAHHLLEDADPFRNPVGHAMREALTVLLDVVLGRVPPDDARMPLEALIRIRAVQDLTPGQAIGFLFQLHPLLGDSVPPETFEDRIHQLALRAFDIYTDCRERLHAIQLRELRRRSYMPERREVRE